MRQSIALFFLGLICLSTVASLNSDISFLKSLKKSDFGKTLVESIQIELKTSTGKDAVDRVLNLLAEIKAQVVKDGINDAKAFKAHEESSNRQINALSVRISNLVRAIADDKNLIKLNLAAIDQAQKDLAFQQKALAEDQRLLSVNQDTQAKETANYKSQFTALSNQITALASARQLLNNMVKGSFVQASAQQFVQLSSSLNNIQFSHPKFAGFVSILSEMLSNTERVHSAAQSRSVIALIDQLYDQLVKQAEHLTSTYKRRMLDLQLVQQRIQFSIETHNQQIGRLETVIAQKQASNVQAQQRIVNNEQRKSESENEKADLIRELSDARVAFNGRVAKRGQEVVILDNVTGIFKSRLTDDVRSSVNVL